MLAQRICCALILVLLSTHLHSQESDSVRYDTALEEISKLVNRRQFEVAYHKIDSLIDLFDKDKYFEFYLQAIATKTSSFIRTRRFEEAEAFIKEAEEQMASRLTRPNPYFGWMAMLKGEIHYYKQEFDKAIPVFEKALTEYAPLETDRSYRDQGRVNTILGAIYGRMSYWDLASKHNTQALAAYTKGGAGNRRLFSIQNNTGSIYLKLGKYDKAREAYENAIELLNDEPVDQLGLLTYPYSNLALLYNSLRKYNLALEYQLQAFRIGEKYDGHDPERAQTRHSLLATAYINAGKDSLAAYHLKQARSYLDKLPEKIYSEEGRLASRWAFLYEKTGEYAKSVDFYKSAIQHYERAYGPDDYNQADQRISLANIYFAMKDYALAKEETRVVIDLYTALVGSKHQSLSKAYLLMSDIFTEQKELDSALVYVNKSLLATEGYDTEKEANFESVLDRTQLLFTLMFKASIHKKLFERQVDMQNFNKALLYYSYCDLLVDDLQSNSVYEDNFVLLEDLEQVYGEAVSLLYDQYSQTGESEFFEKAFYYSDRGKNVLLRQQLNQSDQKKYGSIPQDLIDLEQSLKEDISYLQSTLYEMGLPQADTTGLSFFNNDLFEKKRALDSLREEFQENFPGYFSTRYGLNNLSVETLRAALSSRSQLIQYVVADEAIYAISVSPTASDFVRIERGKEFDQKLNDYLGLLHNPLSKMSALTGQGKELSELLLDPFKKLENHLVIVPDGILNLLPFETLPISDSESTKFLIEKHHVSYATASSLMTDSKKRELSRNIELMAFASSFSGAKRSGSDELREGLDPLAYTVDEVKSLMQIYNGESYIETAATERNFREHAAGKDVIHIASHGLVDYEKPLFSRLMLEKDPEDSVYDGNLFVHELYNMSLDAHMAVLSACNTASGQLMNGEGLLNLGRGFFYAGVPSVVVSHWQVNDQSTNTLMKSFYQHLSEGQRKSEALRSAKLEFIHSTRSDTKHPFYWGAFVTMGDDSPIVRKGLSSTTILIGLVILLALLAIGFSKKRSGASEKSGL